MNTATWPLVGRVTELTQVAAAIDTGAGGVLFAGPAGVGKTRLAFECLGFTAERGYRPAHVRANRSSATIPYGAFAALLPPATSRESESRGDLLRYFAEAILEDPDGRPLLLVVDDAHDLDDPSAAPPPIDYQPLVSAARQVVAWLVDVARSHADDPDDLDAIERVAR